MSCMHYGVGFVWISCWGCWFCNKFCIYVIYYATTRSHLVSSHLTTTTTTTTSWVSYGCSPFGVQCSCEKKQSQYTCMYICSKTQMCTSIQMSLESFDVKTLLALQNARSFHLKRGQNSRWVCFTSSVAACGQKHQHVFLMRDSVINPWEFTWILECQKLQNHCICRLFRVFY